MKECYVCGRPNSEEHHRVFRSECKALERCKKNKVHLCGEHHRGTLGPHGKNGNKFNIQLKIEFQKWLFKQFENDKLYKPSEIKQKLDISVCSTEKLLKTVQHNCYLYKGEDVIRACMGGKLFAE